MSTGLLVLCLHCPMGCVAAGEHIGLRSTLAPAHMLFIIKS